MSRRTNVFLRALRLANGKALGASSADGDMNAKAVRRNAARAGMGEHQTTGMVEPLERRTLLSAFAYFELPGFVESSGPVWVLRPTGDDGSDKSIRTSVDAAGDIDGDGFGDVIVGVAKKGSTADAAAIAVVYSGRTGETLFSFSDGSDEFGSAVAGVGDINGDGKPDVMVGSPGWSVAGGNAEVGRAYLYSGADGSLIRVFEGSRETDRLGSAVAAAGDVNKDGVIDLIVGAPGADGAGRDHGRAAVYSGADGSRLWSFIGYGVVDDAQVGYSVAGAGDVNGDGYADVIIGAPGVTTGREKAPGTVFVYSGKTGATLYAPFGDRDRDQFGFSVDGAGDVNGDGFADFIVGAPSADGEGSGRVPEGGRVVVYSGADGSLLREWRGERAQRHLGAAVAGIGDVDFDGKPDFLVGGPTANPEAAVQVISGADGSEIIRFEAGESSLVGSDRIGTSVAAAGDVNHDGFVDFIFGGTQDANPDRNDRARAYVFSGARAARLLPIGLNDVNDVWGTVGSGDAQQSFVIVRGQLFTLGSRNGLRSSDHVIDINDGHTVLGSTSADGSGPFLWSATDERRRELADLITEFVGGTGTFTGLRAVDITDSGNILVERLRDGVTPTTWLYENGRATYLFDGTPVAMNEVKTVLATAPGGGGTSILWSNGTSTEIGALTGVDLNEKGDVVGVIPGGGPAAIGSAGTRTSLGAIAGGERYVPTAINDDRWVVGRYLVTSTQRTSGFFYSPVEGIGEIRPLVTVDAPASFEQSTDLVLVDLNDRGVIAGQNRSAEIGFLLGEYNTVGPFDSRFGARVTAVAPAASGGVAVTTTNRAGEVIVFVRDAQGRWTATDLSEAAGVPRVNDTVSWNDPRTGRVLVAAITGDGVLLLTSDARGGWSVRDLTSELAAIGATAIKTGLTTFVSIDGRAHIVGLNSANDMVMYRNTSALNWEYVNIYETHLRPSGQPTPALNGKLNSYVTSWNGLNVSGLDNNGNVWAIWTAPPLNGKWESTNLTEITGAPPLVGGLTTYVTGWGGINIAGTDQSGDTIVTWWVPEFGPDWRQNNFTKQFDGPRLKEGSVTSYVTPWGGLNVAGLDEQGRMIVYWWVPGFDNWEVTPLELGGDPLLDRPIERIESYAGPDGSLNLMGVNRMGQVLRAHWAPQMDWAIENLTMEVEKTG